MNNKIKSLHDALQSSECIPSIIQCLVREQPDSLNSIDSKRCSPLCTALLNKQRSELIFVLVKLGASVNFRDKHKYTPLHHAVISYKNNNALLDVVQLLVKFGANANCKDIYNRTPVHMLLHYVEGNMLIKVLNILLKNGVDMDHNRRHFRSYLVDARNIKSFSLHLEISKMLLEFGAKPGSGIPMHEYIRNFETKMLDPYSIHLVKLLMQYIMVDEMKNSPCKINSKKKYAEVINLKAFSTRKCYRELREYRDALNRELIMMFKEKIDQEMTLFSYISERCSSGLSYLKSEDPILYKVISIFHSHRYTCCNDLFIASMKQGALMSVLCNVRVSVRKPIFNALYVTEVVLTSDAILHLATYLSRIDILNLILAYFPQEQNDTCLNQANEKIIHPTDHSCISIKRLKLDL